MMADSFLFVGGCSGSFSAPSGKRPIWPASGVPNEITFENFDRCLFGSRTSNYLLCHGNTFIMIDQGTGIAHSSDLLQQIATQRGLSSVVVHHLQTHSHIDHVNGTPEDKRLFNKSATIHYQSPNLEGRFEYPFMKKVMGSYFRPSARYWPLRLENLPSTRTHQQFEVGAELRVDDITVKTLALNHTNGCCGYRFEIPAVGVVVIATDHEPTEEIDESFVSFISGADLLLTDLQYHKREYLGEVAIGKRNLPMPRKGWGHGYPESVFSQILACQQPPKKVRVIHHDPCKSDMDLLNFCLDAKEIWWKMSGGDLLLNLDFAHENEVFCL